MSQFAFDSAGARALNRVLADGRFTAVELAEVGGCSDRLIGYARTGEKPLGIHVYERIARYVCEHGDTRLALPNVCPSFALVRRVEGTSDGQVRDELVRMVRAMADVDAAHGERDAAALRRAAAAIREALADIEAEADTLEGRS